MPGVRFFAIMLWKHQDHRRPSVICTEPRFEEPVQHVKLCLRQQIIKLVQYDSVQKKSPMKSRPEGQQSTL